MGRRHGPALASICPYPRIIPETDRKDPALPDAAALDEDSPVLLLRRCADGDRAALRRLYERWSARLHGIALRITGQPALAADATHDAFVQIWQQAARFDPDRGSGEAWLISLVRYRALDIVRRRGREVLTESPPEQEDLGPDAFALLARSAEGAALARCLGTLAPDRRQLILLAFVQGLSHSDLAARLDTPLGTVKSWIRRALAALRACLDP